MERKLYSTGDAAKALDIQRYQLTYLVETGHVKEPALRIAGKRAWSEEEIERVREVLWDRGNGGRMRSPRNGPRGEGQDG
jgi:DNA-binding transcriptional MerR regulator